MCGIIGHISKNTLLKKERYQAMLNAIKHRGPDNSGVYYSEKNNLMLGHVRLSIMDTDSHANQPMTCDNIRLVFNGEIYNHRELKEEYLSEIFFFTSSDTEVLLKLYIKLGIKKTLELIRGMFAFSIYDENLGKVYIARDQVGKKPLYYYKSKNDFFYSSEIKAFKEVPGIDFSINNDVFNDTMYYCFSKELSPFSEIKMMDNGVVMEYDINSHKVSLDRYFEFSDLIDKGLYNNHREMGSDDLIDKLDDLLVKSIIRRLMSDVPIGSINSGGVDSSLISAIAYKQCKLKMFHVDVDGMSERHYAELLSKEIKQELIQIKVTANDNYYFVVT